MSRDFCDGSCNDCEAIRNRQLTVILNALHELYGNDVYRVVQHFCPNMTCCADCSIDDFCHDEGCELLDAAEKYAATMSVDVKVPEPVHEVTGALRDYARLVESGELTPATHDFTDYADRMDLASKRAYTEAYYKGVNEGKKYMLDKIRQGISKVAKDEGCVRK